MNYLDGELGRSLLSYLNAFNLAKLSKMINVFMFCYLYCDYYHRSVVKEDSLSKKDNMRRYYQSY